MSKGAVWLTEGRSTRRLRRSSKALKTGQQLHLYYDESVLSAQVAPAKLIEDCDKYSVWYKPSGMLSQGSKWSDHCTITRFAEHHLEPQRNAFLVHRLDRATSGLIVIAHAKQMAAKLSEMFQKRQLDKRYLAVVHGQIEQCLTIDLPVDEKPALSHISPLKYDAQKNLCLVDVKIDTGRKHQIRKHLSSIDHIIVGDRLYGSPNHSVDLQLCAWHLSFECPINHEAVMFEHVDERLLLLP